MEDVLFAGYSIGILLRAAVLGLGAVALAVVVRRLLRSRRRGHFERVRCEECGWRGEVSRFAGRCPRCNNPLGEQRARRAQDQGEGR